MKQNLLFVLRTSGDSLYLGRAMVVVGVVFYICQLMAAKFLNFEQFGLFSEGLAQIHTGLILVVVLALVAVLWRSKTRLLGAVVLSLLTVYAPNIDLIYVGATASSGNLSQLAQASLFYRAIFFVVLVLSQSFLFQRESHAHPRRMKNFGRICAMGLVFSLCATAMAKDFYSLVFTQEFQAPQLLVFLSCFNMAMLTGIFIEIQAQVAALKVKDAGIVLGVQMLSVLIAWSVHLDLLQYLQIQVLVNGLLLFLLVLGAGGIVARQVSN